jgi:hypothetical protein
MALPECLVAALDLAEEIAGVEVPVRVVESGHRALL